VTDEPRYKSAHISLTGDREENQDRCILVDSGSIVLMALADGMGGHPRGGTAAQILIDNCNNLLHFAPQPMGNPRLFLGRLLQETHQDIVRFGLSQTPAIDPRTTAVAALIQNDTAYWAHVGDSRLYLFRNGETIARTVDHSYVQQLRHQGLISEQHLVSHPQRNLVTRCLGGAPRAPDIEYGQSELKSGDLIVICSDGLWSSIDEEWICDTLTSGLDITDAARSLADEAALAAYPGSDNITLIAVKWLSGSHRDEVQVSESPARPPVTGNLDQAITDLQNFLNSFENGNKQKKG
jgi:serine/threonine protein phosphatase PrpC